jgi:hypothetical protein
VTAGWGPRLQRDPVVLDDTARRVLEVLVEATPGTALDPAHIAELASLLPAEVDAALYRLRLARLVVRLPPQPKRRRRYSVAPGR